MQAYALICVGVRLIVTHTAGRSPRATVVHTQGGGTMRDNIVTVLGAASANALQPFNAQLLGTCTATGFVSSPAAGSGRSSSDRQYFYVNGRPVDLPRVAKTLNEVYRAFNSAQFPAAVLDFRLPTDAYDVNVTPDKRRVMLHAEDELLGALHDALTAAYDPSRRTLAVGNAAVSGPKSSMKSKRGSGPTRQSNEADWISDSKDTDADDEEEVVEDSEPELSLESDASGSQGEDERRASKRMRSGRAALEGHVAAAAVPAVDQMPVATGRLDPPPAPPSAAPAARHVPYSAARQSNSAGKPTAEQTLMHRYVLEPAPMLERFSGGQSGPAIDEDAVAASVSAVTTSGPAAETPVPIDVDGSGPEGMPTAMQQAPYDPDAPLSAQQHHAPGETAVLRFDLASLRVRLRRGDFVATLLSTDAASCVRTPGQAHCASSPHGRCVGCAWPSPKLRCFVAAGWCGRACRRGRRRLGCYRRVGAVFQARRFFGFARGGPVQPGLYSCNARP